MKVKLAMPRIKVPPQTQLWLEADFHAEWMCKNGSVRKVDVQNMLKVLIDAVCEKLGVGDEWLWRVGPFGKVHAQQDVIKVRLGLIEEISACST